MKKIMLIIKREYLTRIRKRTFIIATLLLPVLYLLLIFGTGYIANKSRQDLKVGIIDHSGLFNDSLIAKANMIDTSNQLTLIASGEQSFMDNYESKGYSGYIVVPDTTAFDKGANLVIVTKKTYGLGALSPMEEKLNGIWNDVKYSKLGIDPSKHTILDQSKVHVNSLNVKDKTADQETSSKIGYVCAILMYLILILYGSQVMMGVTEEKTSRIAEVVISSVKPFQLMMGKIIGISMVALTQFLIWISCMVIIYNVGKFSASSSSMIAVVGSIRDVLTKVNIPLVVGCFIFYMLAGFFFYASLYAAIGSAINEDMREAQSLSFPITLMIIFSVSLMGAAIANPTGKIAFWASMIPFSSPIVMMTRIPFGVPGTVAWWEMGLSMLILIAGFLFTTWFAARIYRTGILMYGKKPTWREMIKWAFR